MEFEKKEARLFTELTIPEIFVSDYISLLNGDTVKVYLYILFAEKNKISITTLDLSKRLDILVSSIETAFNQLENLGLIVKSTTGYILTDIKEIELNKLYTPKLTSSLEDATKNAEENINRLKIISTINNNYFQGSMSPSWLTDIDLMITKYGFCEEVLIALFNECYNKGKLHHGYIKAVAESWNKNNIKTFDDLEAHYLTYEKNNDTKKKVIKKLRLSRNLTQYEEAYIEKWITDFCYDFNIIELALGMTTSKANPSFNYIDKIITSWHEKGLKTIDEIKQYKIDYKNKEKFVKQNSSTTNANNYTKRKYDDLNKFFDN